MKVTIRGFFISLLIIPSALQAQNVCFRANNDFTSNNGTTGVGNPKYIATGDFNEDGILDVLTSNTTSASVSLFFGQGNGLFVFQDTIAITPAAPTSTPNGIIVADFNGDGFDDFAVAKRITTANPNFMVKIGDGTGNFTTYANLAGSNNETDLVSGDFDNNGTIDVVCLSSTSPGNLSFFGNNGSGFNATVNSVPAGIGLPFYIKSGLFDNDAFLDVLITRDSPGKLVFMKGTGTGTFTNGFNINMGTAPRDLDLGDLNGDGFMDAAVALSGSDSVAIVFSDGSGGVSSLVRYISGGDGPQSIVISDVDADGDKDIVVSNLTDFVIGVLKNDGAGNFTLFKYESFKDPQEILVGNFDSDTDKDIIFTSAGTKSIYYMENDGSGKYPNYNNLFNPTMAALPNSAVAADFDNDGETDAVVANTSTSTFALFTGDGYGNYTYNSSVATAAGPLSIRAHDFDGDSDQDVLLVNTGTNELSFYAGNNAGGFAAAVSVGLLGVPSFMTCGDFDADGDKDAVVVYSSLNQFQIFRNTGGVFASAGTYSTSLSGPVNAAVGLFNGDASPDIAICNNTTGIVTTYHGTGACNFTAATTITFSASPDVVTAGDFNGDGSTDLAVSYGTNIISYANGNGAGSFAAPANLTIASASTILWLVAADFNGDGFADIATANNGTHDMSVCTGGASGLTFQQAFFSGYKATNIGVADINGDNLSDVFVVNSDATGGGSSVATLVNRSAYITAGGPTTFCAGSSVTLTSTEAFSYLWSTSATAQAISASTSGSYTVTTSNLNGTCSSVSLPKVITVNPAPTITGVSGVTVICSSASTTLTASSSATTPSYQWYDAPTGGTLLGSSAAYTTPVLMANTSYYVTVTDLATGCSATSRFQVDVTIGDITPPVISGCPANIAQNNTAGLCGANVSWTAPTALDNCGAATVTQTMGLPSGSTFPIGVTTIEYTATDLAANSSVCSFTITVTDTEAPVVVSCPANLLRIATTGTCARTTSWTAPTVSDNCPGATIVQTLGAASGSSFAVGVHNIEYTATDAAGNTALCSFTLTVYDTASPSIVSCPVSQVLSNTTSSCGRIVSWTAPTTTDNCSGATITQTVGLPSGSLFPIGVNTITYRAVDASGNDTYCTFTITVNDTESPTIASCPSNQTLSNTVGSCGRIVSWTTPTVNDNCAGSSIVQTSGLSSGSLFPIGLSTVVYTATDAVGNTSTCSFDITINDTELPVITSLPSNMTVGTDPGVCNAVVNWTAPGVTDNCAGASVVQTAGSASGSSFPLGVTTITYQATDAAGNIATGSFNITVVDNVSPTFTSCNSNMTFCENETVTFPTPTATDNCTGSVTVTQTVGLPSGSTFPLGGNTVTFRATDGAGNFTNCTFTITINAAPSVSFTLSAPNDEACESDALISLTTGTPAGGIYSGTGVSGGTFDPSVGAGVYPIMYTVTNGNGCADSASASITVLASPTVSFTINDNLACIYHTGFTISGGSPSGGSYSGTGVSGGVFTPGSVGAGSYTVTYTYTDANSCTGSATDVVDVSSCVGVDEQTISLVYVYPNPSSGVFNLQFSNLITTAVQVEVYNSLGQVVSTFQGSGLENYLDLSAQERGIYFLVFEWNGTRYMEKIILQR